MKAFAKDVQNERISRIHFRRVRQRLKNGVAERKNMTIMEAVKTMIHDQDLPMHLWDEAARMTIYVQNRLSHSSLGFKTPEEIYIGKKPEVNHLKILMSSICPHSKRKDNQVEPF